MNDNIQKLSAIAEAPFRQIVGLMSGTSFDGLDVALCQFNGAGLETKIEVLHFKTVPYEPEFKENLKSVFSKKLVDMEKLTLMHAVIGRYHADLVLACLKEWGVESSEIDLIASHGQTVFHAPRSIHGNGEYPNATLQIGDGDHIAVATGIITLSDFRQKHIAAGGEGAPLAVYGDYLLFSDPFENRILLNIGGIANYTVLPAGYRADQVFSSDVGPGNTLMDQFVQQHYPGKYYDEEGAIASSGSVNESLLKSLLDHPFFDLPLPKTTGPELFSLSYLQEAMETCGQSDIGKNDIMATLCRFSAEAIKDSIARTIDQGQTYEIYISGGGGHNPLLKHHLCELLGKEKLYTTAQLGVNSDAKEAVLFALLANEAVAGSSAMSFGNNKGVPKVRMGKISFPN